MTDQAGQDLASAAEEVEPVRVLIASPIGRLGIEFRGTFVSAIKIQPSRSEARRYQSLGKVDLTDFLLEALGRLSELLAGIRTSAGLEIDLQPSGVDGFTRRVLKETRRIGYGKTWSYKKLAEACRQPSAYRRVQAALLRNPIPILIPCHRVVPQKGGVGGYVGGTKKKQKLLAIESHSLG